MDLLVTRQNIVTNKWKNLLISHKNFVPNYFVPFFGFGGKSLTKKQ